MLEIEIILICLLAAIIFLLHSVRRAARQHEEIETLSRRLEEARAEIGELNRTKTQLLSLASHQVKSPLAAINGLILTVSEGLYGPVDVNVAEVLGNVKDSADGLIELIDNLLDVRKVDEGRMDYHFAKTDISILAKEVISIFQRVADSKRIDISFSGPENGVFLNADGQRLKHVIQHLVGNAIKYTHKGFVKVEVSEDKRKIKLCVSDSGMGISKELLPIIFQKFVRDHRIRGKVLGTGLGLYIARKIVEAHGGRIWAESEGEGKGSKFFVSLPVA